MLVSDTRVETSVLPLAEFREHLRLGTGFSDATLQDTVIEGYLRAAISAVEARTGKVALATDFTWTLETWSEDCVRFPVGRFLALNSVALRDADGVLTPYDTTLFRVVPDTHRPQLRPLALSFPSVPADTLIEIKFRAGFGEAWSDVPPDFAQAILLLAAHYYEFRHETAIGEGCMPFGVTSLLQAYRPMRVSLGGNA